MGEEYQAVEGQAITVELGQAYDVAEWDYQDRVAALSHDVAMRVRELAERFEGTDRTVLYQVILEQVRSYFTSEGRAPRVSADEVLERLTAVEMRDPVTGRVVCSLADDVSYEDAATIAVAWDSRLDKQGYLSVDEQVELALRVTNKDGKDDFTPLEVLGEVVTLEPPLTRICTIDDDRGTLVTLEPSGIEMTKHQAMELLAKLAGAIGLLQDREANSLAAKAGQWVADNVSPEVKAEHERNINLDVAVRIEALAESAGVDDEAIMKLIEVDESTYNRLMVGALPWDFEQIGRIANYYQVDPFQLITGANR